MRTLGLAFPRVARRMLLLAGLVLTWPLVGAGAASASARAASGLKFTPATVVISKSLVTHQLRSVSKDGTTYTFASRTGALAKLKAGSVMLLQGFAVRDVTKVKRSGGKLLAVTQPAAITDLIQNGRLAWNTPISFAHPYAFGGSAVPTAGDAASRQSAGDSLASRFGLASLSAGHSVTLKGKAHSYRYSVTFTSVGKAVSVKIKLSKATPVEVSVTITGTLDNLSSAGGIRVANSHLSSATMATNGLKGEFKVAYEFKPISQFGLGQAGGIKIELPAEITVPFAVGPVPFFLGIKTAFFASVGFSSFNQSVSGEYKINYDGRGGFSTSSSGATSVLGALQGIGKVILDSLHAVRNGPLSVIFGAQIPEIELGLGVKGLNVAGNVVLIANTGVEVKGSNCDTRELEIQGDAGAELNFFGFSSPLAEATLFDKKIDASYPRGCGTFGS